MHEALKEKYVLTKAFDFKTAFAELNEGLRDNIYKNLNIHPKKITQYIQRNKVPIIANKFEL